MSDASVFTEAAMAAAEIIKEIEAALEVEAMPFLYEAISPEELAAIALDPDIVNEMAAEFGHSPMEAEPCPACKLVAAKYALE